MTASSNCWTRTGTTGSSHRPSTAESIHAIDTLIGLLLLIAGLALLERGADWFADSSTALARRTGLPLVVVGLLTVGVEWEELAVVVAALIEGSPRLAFGAVVGSAIANLTIVLAAGAFVRPITAGRIERRLGVILLSGTLLVGLIAGGESLGQREGAILLVAFSAYLVWLTFQISSGWGRTLADSDDDDDAPASSSRLIMLIVVGMLLAISGGELAVRGALRIADGLGLAETVVGLTVVALGTSLPDAVVTLAAARRGATGLILANAAGSNLCNLLLLLGLVAVLSPIEVPDQSIAVDVPVLITATALFVWMLFRRRAGRGYAFGLVLFYAFFVLLRVV